jgi:two-component system response regulator YesN
MIVDDEAEVREGIVNKIDWFSLGFEIVAQAENGQDALEKAEAIDIDVILTDIKMPFMDGLAFGARIHDLYPAIKLIVFSGFDKFEYAKEAIKLDAVEFILKPINANELTEVLRRVRKVLDSELAEKLNIEKLRENFENNEPVLREHFLNELLWGILPVDDIVHGISFYKTDIARNGYKIVCVYDIDFPDDGQTAISRDLIPMSVKQIVDDAFSSVCRCVSFISSQYIIAITSWNENEPIRDLMRISDTICADCKKLIGITVTAGIGRSYVQFTDIHLSYEQARASLEYKNIVGRGHAIYIRDMELIDREPNIVTNSQIEHILLAAIKFGTEQQIDELVENVTKKLKDHASPMWQRCAYSANVSSAVSHICRLHGIDEKSVLRDTDELLKILDPENSAEEISEQFRSLCFDMRENMSSRRMTAARNLIESAKEYISVNYHNPRLSVEMLCDYLHISQSYFSTIFKQETKQSYVGYLTDVRIQKAKELLDHTNDKTYIIAKNVGYDDPNYFSYVFKKKVGSSPSQYRKH